MTKKKNKKKREKEKGTNFLLSHGSPTSVWQRFMATKYGNNQNYYANMFRSLKIFFIFMDTFSKKALLCSQKNCGVFTRFLSV